MPLALTLLPLLPNLILVIKEIVDAARADPATPDATRAQLDELAARLDATNAAVQALEVYHVPPDA